MKTSLLIRILLIIVLLGAVVVAFVAPAEAIEKVIKEVGDGQFRKWTIIGALVLCILILAFGPRCVRYFFAIDDSETEEDVELPPGIEKCEFCSKAIGHSQTPYVIKDHVICEKCYKMIKEVKKDSD